MQDNKNILVTGANGQLGCTFRDIAPQYPGFNFTFVSKEELPVENIQEVEAFFQSHQFEYCINCAAYTAVDKAETEEEMAYLVNAQAVGNLATVCKKAHTQLIHISTDYVFDGKATQPIKESDTTDPINVYGASKLKGEQLCLQNNPSAIIIRTSWLYAVQGHNFVKTMLRLMKEKESMNVVNDQVGIPTNAEDLAKAIMEIVSKLSINNCQLSIVNFSNSGEPTSWYNFAVAIKEVSGSNCIINGIATSQYPTPAKRPAYSVLDTTLIKEVFKMEIPHWKESLERTIKQLTA